MLCEDGLIENHYYDGYLIIYIYNRLQRCRRTLEGPHIYMYRYYLHNIIIYLLLKFRSDKSRTSGYFLCMHPSTRHVILEILIVYRDRVVFTAPLAGGLCTLL